MANETRRAVMEIKAISARGHIAKFMCMEENQ